MFQSGQASTGHGCYGTGYTGPSFVTVLSWLMPQPVLSLSAAWEGFWFTAISCVVTCCTMLSY